MKKVSIILISSLLVISALLSACSSPKASANTITVVTDATFAPFEYMDDNGNMTGMDIDIMNAVADKMGVKVDWKNIPFDSALSGLSECQYDAAIAAITITDERKQNMLFTDPYMTAGLIIVVNKSNTTVNSMDDLKGLTVAAQLGTTGEQAAQKIENVNYKPYDSYELAFMDLANGQVDAVIADNPVAQGYISKNPDKLKSVGEVFDSESYGIGVCKTKTELQEKINTALNELIKDGTIDSIVVKYNK